MSFPLPKDKISLALEVGNVLHRNEGNLKLIGVYNANNKMLFHLCWHGIPEFAIYYLRGKETHKIDNKPG